MIDKIYSRFTARLYALHPFNEKEIRICLLIKINLKPSQIAPLIPCAKQTLTSIRKKCTKRLIIRKVALSYGMNLYEISKTSYKYRTLYRTKFVLK